MDLYKKPTELCENDPIVEQITTPAAISQFISEKKIKIEKHVASLGVKLERARISDIEGIQQLMEQRFNAASVKSFRDIYKAIRYGFCFVIKSENNELLGYDLSYCYLDEVLTSNGMSMAIDASLEGNRLGYYLQEYSCLGGMEKGCRVRSGGVHPNNIPSVVNLLNKVGYLCDDYYPNYLGENEPRFIISMPLSPAGVTNNKPNQEKCREFMRISEAGVDYILINTTDLDGIAKLYAQTDFKIVAFIGEKKSSESKYLAIPKGQLNFPEQDFL